MAAREAGDVLRRMPKQLVVRFHTSNMEKFLQARVIFQRHGVTLRYFRESQDPYREEYEMGRRALLQRALEEIRARIGVNSLFFVEDTSVRVDALSDDRAEVPGLRVKEWFRNTTFEELDAELRRHGNRRGATVYSDIGLYIPGLERAVFVHGETSGRISEVAPNFEMSYQFPWLTPSTFNGWFIPEGSDRTLGEMDFEESLELDFRVRSLARLLERIEEYATVLNLPAQAYSVRRPAVLGQEALFQERSPLILVVGRVCAGKTTFGRRLSGTHRWLHVEASDEMNALANELGTKGIGDALARARELLRREGPDCVARNIANKYHDRLESGVVITGFRAIEEVVYFRNRYPSCVVIYINAGDRIRFARHLERGRLDKIRTLEDFVAHDRGQWGFGLLARARDIVDVPRDVADVEVSNELRLEEYFGQIDALVEKLDLWGGVAGMRGDFEEVQGVSGLGVGSLRGRRVFRCLSVLRGIRAAVTCGELRVRMTEAGQGEDINVRHVNWILWKLPELVERIADGGRLRYRILPAGRAYVEAVNLRSAEAGADGFGVRREGGG